MVYDATDKLVTWPGTHQYTYYPTGSLHLQKDSGGTTQKTFAYNGAELLSSVTHAGAAYPSSMTWDADSNRVSFTRSTDGTSWYYVYDTTAGIPAVVEEVTPSDGSIYYIREPGGELIARIDGATTSYYHFDELGSTRMLTNGSGTITDTYTYDAWGKQTAHTAYTGSVDQPYRYVGQLGYYSHYQDTNLFSQSDYQFLQLGVRSYDSLIGRFTQRDSLPKVGSSDYAYAAGAPTISVDPSGRSNAIFPCNSRICNDSKDQCVIVWSDRSGYILLDTGQCTSWFYDDGDFGYWNGHWFKCKGGDTCYIDDRPPGDYPNDTGYLPPQKPGQPRPSPPPKDLCERYCKCQSKSRHHSKFDDSKDCVKKCMNGGV